MPQLSEVISSVGAKPQLVLDLLHQYEIGPVPLPRKAIDSFRRHLVFDHMVDPEKASMRQRFQAISRSVRDLLAQRWLKTKDTYYRENPKRVYYLSMEFLIGRSLANNALSMMIDPLIREMMQEEGIDLLALMDTEPDAGLGNGGLGRLAACFLDSLATLQIPAHGYGLRYEYGVFKQEIHNGFQTETPDNWLRRPDPWEAVRYADTVQVQFGASIRMERGE